MTYIRALNDVYRLYDLMPTPDCSSPVLPPLVFASSTSLFFFLVDLAIRTGLTQGLRLISG